MASVSTSTVLTIPSTIAPIAPISPIDTEKLKNQPATRSIAILPYCRATGHSKQVFPNSMKSNMQMSQDIRPTVPLAQSQALPSVVAASPARQQVSSPVDAASPARPQVLHPVGDASCAHCTGPAAMNRCARCKVVFYCNIGCQSADWSAHKLVCCVERTVPAAVPAATPSIQSVMAQFASLQLVNITPVAAASEPVSSNLFRKECMNHFLRGGCNYERRTGTQCTFSHVHVKNLKHCICPEGAAERAAERVVAAPSTVVNVVATARPMMFERREIETTNSFAALAEEQVATMSVATMPVSIGSYAQRASAAMPAQVKKVIVQMFQDEKHEEENLYTLDAAAIDTVIAHMTARPMISFPKLQLSSYQIAQLCIEKTIASHVAGELRTFVPVIAPVLQKAEKEEGVDVSAADMAFMVRNGRKNQMFIHRAEEIEKQRLTDMKRMQLVGDVKAHLTNEFRTIALGHMIPELDELIASRTLAIERALALRMEQELHVIEAETTTRQMKVCRQHFAALDQTEEWLALYAAIPSTIAQVFEVKGLDKDAIRTQVTLEHTRMLRKKVEQTSIEVVHLTEQIDSLLLARRNAIYAEFGVRHDFQQDVHSHAHERTMLPLTEQLRAWADDHIAKAMMAHKPFCLAYVNGNEKPIKMCISTMRGINCMASECSLVHFITRGENDGCCFFLKTYGKCHHDRDAKHMFEYYHPNGFTTVMSGKGVCQAGHLSYLNGTKITCEPNCNVGTFVHHLNPQIIEVLGLMKKGEFADPMGLYESLAGYVRRNMNTIIKSGWKTDFVVPSELTPQLAMDGELVANLHNAIKSVASNKNKDVKTMPNKYDFFVRMFAGICDGLVSAAQNFFLEGQIKKVCTHNCQGCPNGKHTIALQDLTAHRGKSLLELAEIMFANPLRILDVCEGDAFKNQCNCPSEEVKKADLMDAMSTLEGIKTRLMLITMELAAYGADLETVIDLKKLDTTFASMPAFHDTTACLERIESLEAIDVLTVAQNDLLVSLRVRVAKETAHNAARSEMMKKIEMYTRNKPLIIALQQEAIILDKTSTFFVKKALTCMRRPMHLCRDMGARCLEEVNERFKVPLPDKSEFKALEMVIHQASQQVIAPVQVVRPVVVNPWTEYLSDLHEQTTISATDKAFYFYHCAVIASQNGFSLADWTAVNLDTFQLWINNFQEVYPNKTGYDRFLEKCRSKMDKWDRSAFASQEVDAFAEGDKQRGRKNSEVVLDKVSKKARKQKGASEDKVSQAAYNGENHQDHFTCRRQFLLDVPFYRDSAVFGNHNLECLVMRGDVLLTQLHTTFVNAVYEGDIPITLLAQPDKAGITFMSWLRDKEPNIRASAGVVVNGTIDISSNTFADTVEKYDELTVFREVFEYTSAECPFKSFVQPEVYAEVAPFVDLAAAIMQDKKTALKIITSYVEGHIASTLIEEDDLVLRLMSLPEEQDVVALTKYLDAKSVEVHNFLPAVREFFYKMSTTEKYRLVKMRDDALRKWTKTVEQIHVQEKAKAERKQAEEQLKADQEKDRIAKALALQQQQEAEAMKRVQAEEAERDALAKIAEQNALDKMKPVVVVSKAVKLTKAEAARAAWEKSQADKEAARRQKQQEQEDQRKSKVRELSLAEKTHQAVAAELEEKKQAKEDRAREVAARPQRTMEQMVQERDAYAQKVSVKEEEFFAQCNLVSELMALRDKTHCADKNAELTKEIDALTKEGAAMGIVLGVKFSTACDPLTEDNIEDCMYTELNILNRCIWYRQEEQDLAYFADLKRQHEAAIISVEKEIEEDRIQQELFVRPFREKVKREHYRKTGGVFQLEWFFAESSITFKPKSANKFSVELQAAIDAKERELYQRLCHAAQDGIEHVRTNNRLEKGEDVAEAQAASFQVCREHEEVIAALRVDISRLQIQQGGIPETQLAWMNRPLSEKILREFHRKSEGVFALEWFFVESPTPFKPTKSNKFDFELQRVINTKEHELSVRVSQAVHDGLDHVRLNMRREKGENVVAAQAESYKVCRDHEEAIIAMHVEIGYLQLQQGPMPVAQWSRFVAHINKCSSILDKPYRELLSAIESIPKAKKLLEKDLTQFNVFYGVLQSKLVKSKRVTNNDDE